MQELCEVHGYCLRAEHWPDVIASLPDGPVAFLDAFLLAYGHRPSDVPKRLRQTLLAVVESWLFDEEQGKGSRSGLPLV